MTRIWQAAWLSMAVILACAWLVSAQTKLGPKDGAPLPPADLDRLKIGEQAPDFTLEAEAGKTITLSSYRGQKTVVLVFYRGYW
jgi:cytochrome oxidase Cu insertion factor (SCO1/SenC/PrrC family)